MTMGNGEDKWVSGQLITTMQNFVDNPEEGAVQKAYDGNVYSYKDGKFYMGEDEVTQSQISKNLGMWQYGYTPKDTYTTTNTEDYKKYKIVEGGGWYGAVGDQTFGGISHAIKYFEKLLREQKPPLKEDEIEKLVKAERLKMEAATQE
tara:strand:- start:267 stop:710 length:444 start_codon:yes stop_codon:yes gene_type:complete